VPNPAAASLRGSRRTRNDLEALSGQSTTIRLTDDATSEQRTDHPDLDVRHPVAIGVTLQQTAGEAQLAIDTVEGGAADELEPLVIRAGSSSGSHCRALHMRRHGPLGERVAIPRHKRRMGQGVTRKLARPS
jgi:hypothetical protein